MPQFDLADAVQRAIVTGASGESSRHLADAACTLVLDALEVTQPVKVDTVVASVMSSRDPFDTTLEATPSGRSWLLSGSVPHVPYASDAQHLLVVVRSRPFAGRERGLRVYRVDADTPGVRVVPLRTIDGDGAARVEFDAVQVGDDRTVGPTRDAARALDTAFDCLTLLAAAEMLGAADASRLAAMARVTGREQFGEPLARRQAVAHRVADMTIACDAVRLLLDAAVEEAERTADRPDPLAVATTKMAANTHLTKVTADSHQLHGGEGYYADHPVHRWHRRVSSLALQYGDSRVLHHRAARLLGFSPIA